MKDDTKDFTVDCPLACEGAGARAPLSAGADAVESL